MINKIKRYKIVSLFFRLISPGYSYCYICGLPWNHCKEKTVWYNLHCGYFATCEYCWNNNGIDVIKDAYNRYHKDNLKQQLLIEYDFKHLMDCVKKEYNKDVFLNRIKKIKKIKSRL